MPLAVTGPRLLTPGTAAAGMPGHAGPDPDVVVKADCGVVADPDDPRLTALAPDRDLPPPQVDVTALRILGVVDDPGQSFSVTRGGRSLAIGFGRPSSPAHHSKNCCKARYWLLA